MEQRPGGTDGAKAAVMMPPEARREILLAAWEEDAIFDLLRTLQSDFPALEIDWMRAIADEARAGTLQAYRYGLDGQSFEPVDMRECEAQIVEGPLLRSIYLASTEATLAAILLLPSPAKNHWPLGSMIPRRIAINSTPARRRKARRW
jgi:hypothetical protein